MSAGLIKIYSITSGDFITPRLGPTYGPIVGGVVGSVVGFFFGQPGLGYAIGSTLGGLLNPVSPENQEVFGPRLSDLTTQISTYGAVIPRLYGTVGVSGNIIWIENNALKETITRSKSGGSGGKGGGGKKSATTTVSYSYSATFAVGLCQGPIVGVRRIWISGNLIYDAGSSDPATIVASNAAATGFAIYPGTDTQSPDARMQATLGVANTPAFRGLAYIVFYDFQLAKYGNSLAGAQVRVEILQLGATYTYPYTSFTQPNRYWRRPAWDGTVYCSFAYFHNSVVVSADGLSWTQYTAGTNTSGNQGCASNGAGTLLAYGTGAGTNMLYSLDHGHTWSSASLSGFNGYVTQVEWNGSYFLAITDTGPFFTSSNGIAWTSHTPPGSGNFSHSLCWHPGSSKWYVCTQFGTDPTIYASPNAATGTWSVAYTLTGDLNNFSFSCVHNGRIIFNGIGTGDLGYQPMNVWSDDGVTWNRKNVPMYQYYIFSDGTNCWCGDTNGQMYYSADGVFNWTRWDGPLQAVNHEASYANGFIVCMGQNGVNGYRISKRFVSSLQPTLGSIVSAECLQSSLLTAYDIDVTALTSTVKGYRNGSVGPVRSALEPLQVAWPFDVVQRGYKVKFLPRGGASIATIPASDLDARSAGGAPGVRITSARAGDSDLPKRLSLHYMNVDREYGIDEQYAERGALA